MKSHREVTEDDCSLLKTFKHLTEPTEKTNREQNSREQLTGGGDRGNWMKSNLVLINRFAFECIRMHLNASKSIQLEWILASILVHSHDIVLRIVFL